MFNVRRNIIGRPAWLLAVKFDSSSNLLSSVHATCIILRSVSLYMKLKYYYINIYISVTCTTCSSDFPVNKLSELLEDLIFIDRSAGEIGTCLIPGSVCLTKLRRCHRMSQDLKQP